MKSIRVVRSLTALVAVAAAGLAYWYWTQHSDADSQDPLVAQQQARAALADRTVDSVLLLEDYAIPRIPSEQHKHLLDSVRQAKVQYIVFPPSAPKARPGLDLTARVAIARQLARNIEAETGVSVPDPAVVFEAYDAPRRIEVDQIRARLAGAQAQWLVSGSVWHDAHGQMTIRLTKVSLNPGSSLTSPTFERAGIAISEENPPEAAFRPIAGEALQALGFRGAPAAAVTEAAPSALPLPVSPVAVETTQRSATEGLWLQQLIGVLHDSDHYIDPRPRERVFERTLAAMEALSPDSGDYVILQARALLYTGRPLAARKILEPAASTPETKALLAYVKGDLTALFAEVSRIQRDIPRLIAECELTALRYRYEELDQNDYPAEAQRLASKVPERWQPLFALFVAHQNPWTLPAPSQLKPLLDSAFPVEGYHADDLMRNQKALGGSAQDPETAMTFLVSPLVHAQKWRAANADKLCCEQGSGQWAHYDQLLYLDLVEALADVELQRHVVFQWSVQGHLEQALELADQLDRAFYQGARPTLMGIRLAILGATPKYQLTPERHSQINQEQNDLAKKILSWDSAQSFATGRAVSSDSQLRAPDRIQPLDLAAGLPSADSSVFDFPRRPIWANQMGYGMQHRPLGDALYRDACRLTLDYYWFCRQYLERIDPKGRGQKYREAVTELIEPRFTGNGERAWLLAYLKEKDGDLAGAEKVLLDEIAAGTRQQAAYSALGDLQLRDGRYAQSAETLLAFLALKGHANNTVGLSTYLEQPAYGFSLRGAFPQASRLFEIVAGYRDGSFANLSGIVQHAFIEGQYELARDTLQDQYQRYHDYRSVRRLASLQFMMDAPDDAWSVLRSARTDVDLYMAALVGLRMSGADVDHIAAWVAEKADTRNNYVAPIWQATELLCEDRPAAAVRQIYQVDAKARQLTKRYVVKGPTFEPKNAELIERSELPRPGVVEGYAAIKARDYPEALSILQPLFDAATDKNAKGPRRERPWYVLPYLALAAAKNKGGDQALGLMEQIRGSIQPPAAAAESIGPLRLHLALGVGHAFKGDHVSAEAEIQKARASIDGISGLLGPGYTFVEILSRLDEETRHPAYRAIALEYVRAYQRYEPWAAWAYAFEARYAAPGPERIRAAGITLKLDPQSQWLHELDPETMEQARRWLTSTRWPVDSSPKRTAQRRS